MREVYSNTVAGIDWQDGNLIVKWAKGNRASVYEGVPEQLAEEVMNAPSVGAALRMSIQSAYKHRYL
jgi:hypothetical protein